METHVAIKNRKRIVEVFSAGCSVCEETVKMVRQLACDSCEVKILDMKDKRVSGRAKALGLRSVPAVVVTSSKIADCCVAGSGPNEEVLRAAGVGQKLEHGEQKRVVEVFSAGCAVCERTIELVNRVACDSCDVRVLDMKDRAIVELAERLDVQRVPSVVITTARFAACCAGRGPEATALRAAGIGQRI